jgi:hypothetical protein
MDDIYDNQIHQNPIYIKLLDENRVCIHPLPKKTLKNPLTEKGRIDILGKCRGEKTTHGN